MSTLGESHNAPGGASLTTALSLLISHPTFTSEVARRLTHEEKLRLYALHAQATRGDAPTALDGSPTSRSTTTTTTAVTTTGAAAAAALPVGRPASAPDEALGWFDFAARARRRRWESLRGRMSPSVAAESFCAEVLALLDRYPARELVPLVESALSRARDGGGSSSSGGEAVAAPDTAEEATLSFCIRAFQHDPAAMAMLWVCRAYSIPCELTAEPLTATAAPSRDARRGSREPEQDLFFTAAAAALREGAAVPFYTGVRRGQRFVAEVAGPEAGFQLLCSTFLAHLPHWAGASGEAASVRLAAAQAEWIEDLVSVTAHLRTPTMVLLLAEAASATAPTPVQPAGGPGSRSLPPRPRPELAALSGHLNFFQRSFVQRRLLRGTFARDAAADTRGQNLSERSPLSQLALVEEAAAARFVDRYYRQTTRGQLRTHSGTAPSHTVRLVSCVDLYIACCGYVLCTSPLAAQLFSRARVGEATLDGAAWATPTRLSALADPPIVPHSQAAVRLAGMPPGYNAIINGVLRSEAHAVRAALAEPVVDRRTLPHPREGMSGAGDGAGGHVLTNAYAAVEAVELFMFSRLLSLNEEDLRTKAAGGAAVAQEDLVDGARTPFLPLAHILTGAWWLAHRQCVGFPLLTFGHTPNRRVDFLWSRESSPGTLGGRSASVAGETLGTTTLRVVPAAQLGVGESYGVDSWEGRLRAVGWSVVASILAATATVAGRKEGLTSPRARTYSTIERAQAQL